MGLAGHFNDSEKVESIRLEVDELMLGVQNTLWQHYDGRYSGKVHKHFEDVHIAKIPLDKEWREDSQTFFQVCETLWSSAPVLAFVIRVHMACIFTWL